jgi:hypothetical protein
MGTININTNKTYLLKNSNISGAVEKPNYISPPSFNEVTNQYDSQSSSFIGGNGQREINYSFNFGDINITATDGKIDEQGFRTQIEQVLRDIQLEQQDTQLRDIA